MWDTDTQPHCVSDSLTQSYEHQAHRWANSHQLGSAVPLSISLSLSSSPGGIWTPNVAAPPTADWLTGPLGLWQRDTEACWAERMPCLYKSDYTVSSNCVRSTELKSGSFMWLATWWQVAIYLLHCSLLQFRERRDGRKHLLLLYNYRLGFFW